MRYSIEEYLAQFDPVGSVISMVLKALSLDPRFRRLTPEQRAEVKKRLRKDFDKGLDENQFVRPLKKSRRERLEIKPLPFRAQEYGQVCATVGPEGFFVWVRGGRNYFRYGDPIDWLRSVLKDEYRVSWKVDDTHQVDLYHDGAQTKISDRFEFDQAEMVEFLSHELPKFGKLFFRPDVGGIIHLEAEYRGVPVRQRLRDAKLRFESQDPIDRLVELFGEIIVKHAVDIES